MISANAYLIGSLILALVVALSGAYRYFSSKASDAVKSASTVGEAKGIQDSALRDNTTALRELRISMERYMERTDERMNAHDALLAVHASRLDTLDRTVHNNTRRYTRNVQRADNFSDEEGG